MQSHAHGAGNEAVNRNMTHDNCRLQSPSPPTAEPEEDMSDG